eukprot:CAMPEP_0172490688 /NCGR_PEP_ID=MMETSP1066-20121228/21216_1 /TAXON_ID=671091 /ORGANISM="Coscinodiscus wailesii, Strain CCMP2513" /LENGTH=748 /DNA_ID=CAMNT_0013259291 /DNA_START=40 /DNA_END=2286 /DNA_ORIENTATION=+
MKTAYTNELVSAKSTAKPKALAPAPDYKNASLPHRSLPPSEEYVPVEQFVSVTISNYTNPQKNNGNGATPVKSGGYGSGNSQYRILLDCLRQRDDPPMLWKTLLALHNGPSVLGCITSFPETHAHLVHLIFRLDSFKPPVTLLEAAPLPVDPSSSSSSSSSRQAKKTPVSSRRMAAYRREKEEWDLTEARRKENVLYYESMKIADAHLRLVVALVSANCNFLVPGLEMMWRAIRVNGDDFDKRETRLHTAIATTLRLVPRGHLEIAPIIVRHAPHRNVDTAYVDHYARQCFTLLTYAPNLQGEVLKLLVNKALEFDVEIKVEDGGVVRLDEEEVEEKEEVFELEDDKEEKGSDRKERIVDVDEMADKLDSLMLGLFQYLQNHPPSKLYHLLLPIFTASILTTYKSKYVQFIMFVILGADAENNARQHTPLNSYLYRHFAALLINTILDPTNATIIRQTSACYLASFVSRANFVNVETVCETVAALLRWTEVYLSLNPMLGSEKTHVLFYTVTQAAFYIMCFRGKEAVAYFKSHGGGDEAGIIDVGRERWDYLCASVLCPMKYCLETVRREFLDLAETCDLLSPSLLHRLHLEEDKLRTPKKRKVTKITISGVKCKGGVGGLGSGHNPLDTFFPFDPYLLRRSFPHVETYYTDWKDDEDSDDESEAAEDDVNDSDCESESEYRHQNSGDTLAMSFTSTGSVLKEEIMALSVSHEDAFALTPQSKIQDQKQAWEEEVRQSQTHAIGNGSW